MDILTHTLSGLAAGTVMAGFSSNGWKEKSAIILFSGFGSALPDLDAISMWSKFDATFGKVFSLEHTGKFIYSAKYWYSHHAFMHSLFAAIVFAIIIGLLFWIFVHKKKSLAKVFYDKRLLLSGFILGFVIHLLEDMVTPSSTWGGVRFFFPAQTYIGGTGEVWWWNNYSIFLTILFVLLINLCLLAILNTTKYKPWKFVNIVFLIGFISIITQIKTTNYNFNLQNYPTCEQESKEIQKHRLGEKVYQAMEKFDNSLKIYF